MTDHKKMSDSSNKQSVVSLNALRSENGSLDSHAHNKDYLRDPEVLMRHIENVATVDSGRADQNPDKPATRVSSLASFRSPSTESPFVVKRTRSESAETNSSDVGNVRSFPKTTEKPRKT